MTRYVEERREVFGVEPICRVLGVPVSTHYARRSRKPSRRELADRQLLGEIEAARVGYRRAYGARKYETTSGCAASCRCARVRRALVECAKRP